MNPKIILTEQQIQDLVIEYRLNLSVIKTAKKFNLGKNKVRKTLKEAGVLLTLSEYGKLKIGDKNPFYKKTHNLETKAKISKSAKTRTEKRNPNYKHGNYIRRPRDFKISEFTKLRNFVFNRDNYTCQITGKRGENLHAHHLIPYWVCPEAFLDIENLITVSTKIHFNFCHIGDWVKFNPDIVSDKLLQKYSIQRERLNELADFHNKKRSDVIGRTSDINKTEEFDRNDQTVNQKD